jgi:two-component system sensor histidine kinase UhpB
MSVHTPELAAVLFRRTLLASAGVALMVAVGLGTLTVVNVRQEVRAARELVELAVQASRTNATTAQDLRLPDLDPGRMRGLRLRLVEEAGDPPTASPTAPRSLLERLAESWFGVSDRFLIPLTDDAGGPALVVEGHAVGELQEQVFDMSIVLGALALALVALGIGHGWVVRGVRGPLSDMTRAAASMAEGELSRRVPEPRIAEFASLARALNHLAQSLEQTRRMQRELTVELVNLREDERKALARELHDDLGQRLAVIAAETHLLRASCGDSASVASIAAGIHSLQHSVRSILERLRQGQPMVLPELDAPAVLDDWRRREPAVRWQIGGIDRDLPARFGDTARATLARVLQEALANAFRHARPTQVSVRLVMEPETARLSITNDGVAAVRRGCGAGHGILGMRERAHGSGGSLQAGPAAAGSWEVELCLPVAKTGRGPYTRIAHRQPAPLAAPAGDA